MDKVAARQAEALKLFDSIFIPNARTEKVCAVLDELIARRQAGGGEHGSVLVVGPSQSGKSTSLRHAIDRYRTHQNEHPPILHVTLPANVNRKSMLLAIFHAAERRGLFRPDSVSGNETQLQHRAYKLLEHNHIVALILDECHHIQYGRKQDAGVAVGEMIKTFLIDGPCPVILAGVGDDAKKPYLHNSQLMNRSRPFIELEPLTSQNAKDRKFFEDFFGSYFRAMDQLEIVEGFRAFVTPEFSKALFNGCGGVIGVAIRILQRAVTNMIYDGRKSLELWDFHSAHEGLLLTREFQTENPFEALLTPSRVSS